MLPLTIYSLLFHVVVASSTAGISSPLNSEQTSRPPLEAYFAVSCVSKDPYSSYECGEDAAGYAESGRFAALAIADGLGGYSKSSGSGVLASSMVERAVLCVANSSRLEESLALNTSALTSIVKESFVNSCPLKNGLSGATTFSFGLIDLETHELSTANLGDGVILVIRDGQVVFKTDVVQATFNAPAYFEYNADKSMFENLLRVKDDMEHSQLSLVSLERGDIVIAGSDGLFDNLFDEEITEIVVDELSRFSDHPIPDKAEKIAQRLKFTAYYFSRDIIVPPNQRPFFKAREEFIERCQSDRAACSPLDRFGFERTYPGYVQGQLGGKLDDISIIVGLFN